MRGYVETRWGQVHYESAGSGPHTFVLFHETPLNHKAYQRLIPLLAEHGRVVAFDTPGYGESDPPPAITTMEEYAATLAEAFDPLGLDGAVLYGYHTGASLAFELAARAAREQVAAVAVSGLPFYAEDVRRARRVREVPAFVADGSHLLDTFCWEPDSYDAELRSRLVTGVSANPEGAYHAFHAVYAYEPGKVAGQVRCPLLAISHPLDPLFENDIRVVDVVPGARQVVLDAERLPLYWTVPELVAGQLVGLATLAADMTTART